MVATGLAGILGEGDWNGAAVALGSPEDGSLDLVRVALEANDVGDVKASGGADQAKADRPVGVAPGGCGEIPGADGRAVLWIVDEADAVGAEKAAAGRGG